MHKVTEKYSKTKKFSMWFSYCAPKMGPFGMYYVCIFVSKKPLTSLLNKQQNNEMRIFVANFSIFSPYNMFKILFLK